LDIFNVAPALRDGVRAKRHFAKFYVQRSQLQTCPAAQPLWSANARFRCVLPASHDDAESFQRSTTLQNELRGKAIFDVMRAYRTTEKSESELSHL